MDTAIELIVSWIQRNLKNPKLYAVLAVLLIIVAIAFPYIDANFLSYNRIEKRVSILQSLSAIDMEKNIPTSSFAGRIYCNHFRNRETARVVNFKCNLFGANRKQYPIV